MTPADADCESLGLEGARLRDQPGTLLRPGAANHESLGLEGARLRDQPGTLGAANLRDQPSQSQVQSVRRRRRHVHSEQAVEAVEQELEQELEQDLFGGNPHVVFEILYRLLQGSKSSDSAFCTHATTACDWHAAFSPTLTLPLHNDRSACLVVTLGLVHAACSSRGCTALRANVL